MPHHFLVHLIHTTPLPFDFLIFINFFLSSFCHPSRGSFCCIECHANVQAGNRCASHVIIWIRRCRRRRWWWERIVCARTSFEMWLWRFYEFFSSSHIYLKRCWKIGASYTCEWWMLWRSVIKSSHASHMCINMQISNDAADGMEKHTTPSAN